MKIRQQMRKLYRNLRNEVMQILWGNHNHDLFAVKGTGCVLCRLLDPADHPLAVLQMAREKGYVADWLMAEKQMCDLLGTERFRRKIQRDMDFVKSMPKVKCENCGSLVFVFMTLKAIAHFIASRSAHSYKAKCQYCDEIVVITENLIPSRLMRTVQRYIRRQQVRKLSRRKRTKVVTETTIHHTGLPHNPFAQIHHIPSNTFLEDLTQTPHP